MKHRRATFIRQGSCKQLPPLFGVLNSASIPAARRDKYQRKIKEYWVEDMTTGEHEKESAEEMKEKSWVEGLGSNITMGGLADGRPEGYDGPNPSDEEGSEESEESDDSKDRKRPKKAPHKSKEVEEEYAIEAGGC